MRASTAGCELGASQHQYDEFDMAGYRYFAGRPRQIPNRSPTGNSHPLNTHRYQLTDANWLVVQGGSAQ